MSLKCLMFLGVFNCLSVPARASEFLKSPSSKVPLERVSEDDIRISLLDEVEGSLGKGSASNRLSQIEASLRPIVAALPKNAHGNLEHSAVSYALHRLFVLRHGWVIKGLSTDAAQAQNSSSPAGVLKDQVPSYITRLFEERLAGKGFALHELAVLASTIEHLIHNEALARLGATFKVHGLPVTSPISKEDASEVLDTYFMAYILGESLGNLTLDIARQLKEAMPEVFLAWRETQKFVDGVRKRILKDDADGVDFASLAKVVEAAGEEFGTFQDFECRQMKDTLVKMEYRGTGRVRLADFYRPALDGAWTFQESSGYLRSLGALDESDPNQPSVMMVNYITSPSNCIASSGFYSVCCKNECDALMGHLEEHIRAPEAEPSDITTLITNLPSQSVTAPQKLSSNLLQRLEEIATTHSGMVPLHSRLFSQWMHHVYPRECPYPHIAGTTDSKLPEEWLEASGEDGTATEEEMKYHVERAANATQSGVSTQGDLAVEDLMPWSSEEELIVVRPVITEQRDAGGSMSSWLRSLVLLTASGSLAYGMIRTMQKTSSLGPGTSAGNEKYMV